MNMVFNLRLAALATLVLPSLGVADVANASLFSQLEVDQNRYAIVASPYGGNLHQLLILKQISNARQCWSESGNSPTTINPLLLEFDFTNICGRSTDSNGYSVRVGGEDMNWRYSLRAARRGNDLHLLAVPTVDRAAPELLVARTRGYAAGFSKFYLEPGWKLTERAYQGSSVGHIYLTNDQSLASLNAAAVATRPVSSPIATQPAPVAPISPVVTVQPVPPVSVQPVTKPAQVKPAQAQPARRGFFQRIFRR